MKLVVLNVAYPFTPIGPDACGNAEQLLMRLDETLSRSGHESFVMACEGSVTEGILLATPKPSAPVDPEDRRRIHDQYRFTLQTFLEKWPIDLIHMHGPDFYEYLPARPVPVLVTLHLPIDLYPKTIFQLDRPQTYFQCVSAQQRNACPPCPNLLPEIATNGFRESANAVPAAPFLDSGSIEKYFSLYERLVGEARALEALAGDLNESHLAHETVRA